MSKNEFPNGLDDIINQGRNRLSGIDDERAQKLAEEERIKQYQADEESKKQRDIVASQENLDWLIKQSAVPFLSRINQGMLSNKGVIFDWTKYDLKSHWHLRSETRYHYSEYSWETTVGYEHKISAISCGITLLGKGRVSSIVDLEEQTSEPLDIEDIDDRGPYKIRISDSIFGTRNDKIYLKSRWLQPTDFLRQLRYLNTYRVQNESIAASSPEDVCSRPYATKISLALTHDEIMRDWVQAMVAQIENIY